MKKGEERRGGADWKKEKWGGIGALITNYWVFPEYHVTLSFGVLSMNKRSIPHFVYQSLFLNKK